MDSIEKAYGRYLERHFGTKKPPRSEGTGHSSSTDHSTPGGGRLGGAMVSPSRGEDAAPFTLIGRGISPTALALSRQDLAVGAPTLERGSRPTLRSEADLIQTQKFLDISKQNKNTRSGLPVVGLAAVGGGVIASIVSFSVIDHLPPAFTKDGPTASTAQDGGSAPRADRSDDTSTDSQKIAGTHVPPPPAASEPTETSIATTSQGEIVETAADSDQPAMLATTPALATEPQANTRTLKVTETLSKQKETAESAQSDSRASMETTSSGPMIEALLRLQRGDLEASLAFAEEGLALAPRHAGLQAIKDEVSKRLSERARLESQIGPLLATALEHRQQSRLMTPPGNNAYEAYRLILAIDPRNHAAQQGLVGIADDYLALARQAGNNGNWRQSLTYAERGLSLAPTDSNLLELRDRAAGALQVEGRRVASSRQAAQNTPPPPPPAAPARQAPPQTGEPIGQRAARDTARFVAGLSAKARQLKVEGRFTESRTLTETGLRLAPRNPELLALREELQ